jgi:hypothetical protein
LLRRERVPPDPPPRKTKELVAGNAPLFLLIGEPKAGLLYAQHREVLVKIGQLTIFKSCLGQE